VEHPHTQTLWRPNSHNEKLDDRSQSPKLGTPPAPAPLRKISLDEHFGHATAFRLDSDVRFETRKEANIGHFDQSC
jgi:hypothetical protein